MSGDSAKIEIVDFPVCGTDKRIPWSIAERAYEGYVKKFGRCQTLERIAERGGFYPEELDNLYPHWREHVEEIYLLRAEVNRLRNKVEKDAKILSSANDQLNPKMVDTGGFHEDYVLPLSSLSTEMAIQLEALNREDIPAFNEKIDDLISRYYKHESDYRND